MIRDRIYLVALGAILFLPLLGSVHLFDWDEINFAESAREMLVTGNWWQVTINFEPFREKPPLFFWMQAISMMVFGVGEFAARFPNAVCGMLTLQVLYSIGSRWQSRRFAWLWVLLYVGSFLPHLYFKSGIIDPWFNLFIFLGIYHLFLNLEHGATKPLRHALLSGMFIGLAILTKGPVGLLILLLCLFVWLALYRKWKAVTIKSVLLFALSSFLVSMLWFGFEWWNNGPWFIVEFISYQVDLFLHPVAGHKQPFFYHFLVVLIGCFPMSVLALPAFHRGFAGDNHHLSRWMKMMFWVVILLFSIVTTKIVHYSSLTYLPLSYLAALAVIKHGQVVVPRRWQQIWLGVQGLLLALAFTAIPLLLLFKHAWMDRISDPFAKGNLAAEVPWTGFESLIGVLFGAMVIYTVLKLRAQPLRPLHMLLIGNAVCIFLLMAVLVPRIEGHSQRTAIEFFEHHQGEDAWFELVGYKSYAHYFYGRIQPESQSADAAHHYVICKSAQEHKVTDKYPMAERLSEKGGFVFFKAD